MHGSHPPSSAASREAWGARARRRQGVPNSVRLDYGRWGRLVGLGFRRRRVGPIALPLPLLLLLALLVELLLPLLVSIVALGQADTPRVLPRIARCATRRRRRLR